MNKNKSKDLLDFHKQLKLEIIHNTMSMLFKKKTPVTFFANKKIPELQVMCLKRKFNVKRQDEVNTPYAKDKERNPSEQTVMRECVQTHNSQMMGGGPCPTARAGEKTLIAIDSREIFECSY
uniref:Uncharacterized protein n=1 Tax=Glossina pallidipes TaxID=7398 RepID=A0A1A9ZGD3_GLOPL